MLRIEVEAVDQGQRLDKFLLRKVRNLSFSFLQSLIRKKDVKVNRRRTSGNYLVLAGDVIEVYASGIELSTVQCQYDAGELEIVEEHPDFMVLWKPVGLSAHGENSLLNRVHYYLRSKESDFKPQLVHRLDRNTSGFLIVAKNYRALQTLSQSMRQGEIVKRYIAEVQGNFQEHQYLRNYHRVLSDNRVEISDRPLSGSSEAVLEYWHLRDNLIDILLITGRKHQIRAQLAFHGIHIVGDHKYGYQGSVRYQRLVAYSLSFSYQGKQYTWKREVSFDR